MNIYTKDLNLLGVFDVLMQEKHVGRTAKRLGLSQPAISHQMARLREMFDDPLFVRAPNGIIPTQVALDLETPLRESLAAISHLFDRAPFDPQKAEGTVRLGTTDYVEQILLPVLLPKLEKAAPSVRLVTSPLRGRLPSVQMIEGQLDIAVAGFFGEIPAGFQSRMLFKDTFACAVRKNHPTVNKKLTLKKYLSLNHLLITLTGDLDGRVDQILRERGLKRNVIAGISNFITPGWVIAESDYILTAPKELLLRFAEYLPIKLFEPPLDLNPIEIVQVWHNRSDHDPLCRWFRSVLSETLGGVLNNS